MENRAVPSSMWTLIAYDKVCIEPYKRFHEYHQIPAWLLVDIDKNQCPAKHYAWEH
jgi:hypothetical protein